MQCPIDGTSLAMTSRDGIEIDYCPQCRGVWLDRGELDKLIERAAVRDIYVTRDDMPLYEDDSVYKRKNDDAKSGDQRPQQGKRRGSFLEDIFDIFD